MTKGNLAWSGVWSDEFTFEFDVIVTSGLTANYHNIFHVTTGGDAGALGNRIPAVWANKAKYFHICSGVNGNANYCRFYPYNLKQSYHFEISQKKNSNGEAVYKISVDGTIFHEVINTTPKNFQNAKLYLSDPWYASFAPHGTLSNLRIINEPSKLDSGD